MNDLFTCQHCKSRRGLELVDSKPPAGMEHRRCLDCGKSTMFVVPKRSL